MLYNGTMRACGLVFVLSALLLASCSGEQVPCADCGGDGMQTCRNYGLNTDQVQCDKGTMVCGNHNPIGATGFCKLCLGRDGKAHAKCSGTGKRDEPCEKCDGAGTVTR